MEIAQDKDGSDLIFSRIKKDLSGFADPGTRIVSKCEDVERKISEVSWIRSGNTMVFRWHRNDELAVEKQIITCERRQIRFADYFDLLLGDNLQRVATNSLRLVSDESFFIAPRFTGGGAFEEEDVDPFPRFDRLIRAAPNNVTLLPFVTASAGIGKTTLLKELGRQSARKYLEGTSSYFFIYIDAQGKALATIDDAIASNLDDLRASFTYTALQALVRLRKLALIVDGFDELLGTSGDYSDAFSSLSAFLNELDGAGVLVAAARSAFYQREFAAKAGRSAKFLSGQWELHVMHLLPWGESQQNRYIDHRLSSVNFENQELAAKNKNIANSIVNLESVTELRASAFFISRICDLAALATEAGDSINPESDSSVLDWLVSEFVQRESNTKVLGSSRSILSKDQLSEFYAEVAEEMWKQGVQELSDASVQLVAELTAEKFGLDSDASNALSAKSPSSAVLKYDAVSQRISFQHEVYFSYFLFEALRQSLKGGKEREVRNLLRRGLIPKVSARHVAQAGGVDFRRSIELLCNAGKRSSLDQSLIRVNAGTLIAFLIDSAAQSLSSEVSSDLALHSFDVTDHEFPSLILSGVSFSDCSFNEVSFANVKIEKSTAEKTTMSRVTIDPEFTVFEVRGLEASDFIGVRSTTAEEFEFDFSAVEPLLRAVSISDNEATTPSSATSPEVSNVLKMMEEVFRNTNRISEGDDNKVRRLTNLPAWVRVRDAMIDSGILLRKQRSARGTNNNFLQINAFIGDVLRGHGGGEELTPRIRAFWAIIDQSA